MQERQPPSFDESLSRAGEYRDRILRLPPVAKQYLRLNRIANSKSIAPESRLRARDRLLDVWNSMTDENVDALTGFLQWRNDRRMTAMKEEIGKRKSQQGIRTSA